MNLFSELRIILDRLQVILNQIELPNYLHGGRKGCSIITNARVHVGKAAVLNFDIQDFFPSIHYTRVYKLFSALDSSPDVARVLTRLTTYGGCVPHGSPTSTAVANLCIVSLARRIKKLADKHNSDFTQFVDDGVMSGPAYIEHLRRLIDKIILQEGFAASPKPNKRRTVYRNKEQVVTGVKVNYCIDVSESMFNKVRVQIAQLSRAIRKGRDVDKSNIASLRGRINHVKTLNKEKGDVLRRHFEKCVWRKWANKIA